MVQFPHLVKKLLISVVLIGSGSVWAQSPPPAPAEPQGKGDRPTLQESVRRVERQTGGEVLRAEPMQRDGREVYRLKVLTADGRVRVMQDDPNAPNKQRAPSRSDKEKQSSDRDGDPPQY